MNPAQVSHLLQQGLAHHQAGRLDQAELLYRQVRAKAPRNFDGFNLSGVLAYQQGRHGDAIALLTIAVRLDARSAVARLRLGASLGATGRHGEAVPHLQTAVQIAPNDPENWNGLGLCLRAVGQFAEAAAAYERAITLKPDFYEALERLGALMADTQGLPSSIPVFQRGVQIRPNHAVAWGNLALALAGAGRHIEALEAFDQALRLDPQAIQPRVGRALALQQTFRVKEAATELATVLSQAPLHREANSCRLLTLNYLSGLSREQVFAEHCAFDVALRGTLERAPEPLPASTQPPGRPLRVAFLSPDLRNHPVASFVEPILRHLDRSRFEIILYHDHFVTDATSRRLGGLVSLWRNLVGLLQKQVEEIIRADAPDILIDLAGHTGLNRLPLFARRVAPVLLTYLGYPNTTGLREMDFRLVDAITDPGPEDDRYHTEKLLRFAPCAWAYQPPPEAPEPYRANPTVPAGARGIVFGSFNNFIKVSDATLSLWRRVLAAVPDSSLVLKGHHFEIPAIARLVRQRIEGLCEDPTRITLLGQTVGSAEHFARYSEVDIALDSHPYNGTTTTCEALWMGVPVVALAGDRHAARVSASLLTAAGHPEWIARSEDDYARIASSLAADPARLATLRSTLRDELRRSLLCDHATHAARFGDALLQCHAETLARNSAPGDGCAAPGEVRPL